MSNLSPKDDKTDVLTATAVDLGDSHYRTVDVFNDTDSGVDPVYHAKATLLNEAIQHIGMGRYQVRPNMNSGKPCLI